jgi:hypothetical protein
MGTIASFGRVRLQAQLVPATVSIAIVGGALGLFVSAAA